MTLLNSNASYGSLTRALHWLTVLVVLSAFPLGLLANGAPTTNDSQIARAVALFSAHKTLGVTAFALGIARLALRALQPQPGPLHPDRRLETFLAAAAHWTLTLGLIAVPLTGWLVHSAAPGLAPILWPFGQSLPAVPASESLARLAAAAHWLATKLLAAAILLHAAGALKHAFLDRDATLARMIRGTPVPAAAPRRTLAAPALAAALWVLIIAAGAGLAPSAPTAGPRDWPVRQTEIVLLDPAGTELERTDVPGALLTLTEPPEAGTLDFALPLDAFTPDAAASLMSGNPFPLILFTGSVDGGNVVGVLDWGGAMTPATFTLRTDDRGVKITGRATLRDSGHTLVLDLAAGRPEP